MNAFKSALKNAFNSSSVIAVTGRMACGKNAVCSILEKSGAVSVDADLLVHAAIKNKNDQIIKTFEPYASKKNLIIQNEDGSVNRRALGKLLFEEPNLLAIQESLVYPEVTALTKEFLERNKGKLCIINATVLYKTPDLLNLCDFVLFVDAPYFKRFIRAKKRDGLSAKEIFKRFKSQKSLLEEYKKSRATIFVLKNNGNLSNLQKKLN